MPSSKAEKTYNKDFPELFKAAQQALMDIGASIESADQVTGEIKSIKKFQLFKKAKFTIIVDKSGTVSAESAMSALVMGAIDIGRNAKFIKTFFTSLDNSLNTKQNEKMLPPEQKKEKPEEENIQTGENVQQEEELEAEFQPLAEHHETLYAEGSATKKGKKDKETHSQRIWRDVNAIEERVDNIHKSKAKKPTSELNKTVDKILSKRKKK